MFTFLRSRHLTFDHDATRVLAEAFGIAWEKYRSSPSAPKASRAAKDHLAETILTFAERFPDDPKGLAKRALEQLGVG